MMNSVNPPVDINFLHCLSCVPELGSVSRRKMLDFFGNAKTAWSSSRTDLRKSGLTSAQIEGLFCMRNKIDPESELEFMSKEGIQMIAFSDPSYPQALRQIYDWPTLLYTRGNAGLLNSLSLAVVGSRTISGYGETACRSIAGELARRGIVIVSGMAYGIDACAHRAALDSNGSTIAVLGSGLDRDSWYPAAHRKLAQKILDSGGLLLSEFPCKTDPKAYHFPLRNRIISGISRGTLVVEAAAKSGSLITAQCALEQGRDVFAVPGPITARQSAGCNRLIAQGSYLVSGAEDILTAWNLDTDTAPMTAELPFLDDDETRVLSLISKAPISIDNLSKNLKLPPARLIAIISKLELKNLIISTGIQQYGRA